MRRRIDFIDVIMVLTVVAIAAFALFAIFYVEALEVVDVYSVGCEVSQVAYAEEAVTRSSTRSVYKMGVRCDDFATTFDINSTQFAQYVVGDIVEVEVTELETIDGGIVYQYQLLGPCQE